jgi:hypothetical protein
LLRIDEDRLAVFSLDLGHLAFSEGFLEEIAHLVER